MVVASRNGKLADTAQTNGPAGVTPTPPAATYQLGHRFTDKGKLEQQDAWLYDAPSGDGSANAGMVFETTALALDGAQASTYYGSVKWG